MENICISPGMYICTYCGKIPFPLEPHIPRTLTEIHPGVPFTYVISWSCAPESEIHTDIKWSPLELCKPKVIPPVTFSLCLSPSHPLPSTPHYLLRYADSSQLVLRKCTFILCFGRPWLFWNRLGCFFLIESTRRVNILGNAVFSVKHVSYHLSSVGWESGGREGNPELPASGITLASWVEQLVTSFFSLWSLPTMRNI